MKKNARLPDFLVIGAGKSGTTSIHEYLRQNDSISLPKRKETHFFICDSTFQHRTDMFLGRKLENPIYTMDEYLAEFENQGNATVFGEVCPTYMHLPHAAENIHRYIPGVKLIAVIRNPVDRLYTNYVFNTPNNSLQEFCDLCSTLPESLPNDQSFARWVLEGNYFEPLNRYFKLFPKEKILIIQFDDFERDPALVMKKINEFIGLDDYQYETSMKFNTSGKLRYKFIKVLINKIQLARFLREVLPVRTYQKIRDWSEKRFFKKADPLPVGTRKKIMEFYLPDIKQVEILIGQNLSNWYNR